MNIIDHFTTGRTLVEAVQLFKDQVVVIIAKDAPIAANILIGSVTEVTETGVSIGKETLTLEDLDAFDIYELASSSINPIAGAHHRRSMLLNDGDVFASHVNGAIRLFRVAGVSHAGITLEGARSPIQFGTLGPVDIVEHRGESTLDYSIAVPVVTGQLELVAA